MQARLTVLGWVVLLAAPLGAAQASEEAPAPGVEFRELQRIDPDRFRPEREIDLDAPELPGLDAPPDLNILVHSYEFEGNTVFPDAELAALFDDVRGEIHLRDLYAAVRELSRYYRDAGYMLARAYVPEQVLDDGVLRIGVIEGRVGEIHLDNESPVSDWRLLQAFDRLVERRVIRRDELERGILLVDDFPGVVAGVTLEPGTETGTTDLRVRAVDAGRVEASLDYNNFGSKEAGRQRVGLQVSGNNLLGIGDRWSLRPTVSENANTLFGSISYGFPFWTPATRLGVSVSRMESEVEGDFEILDIKNIATTSGVHVSHALIRSRARNVHLRVAYEHRQLEQENILFDSDYTLDVIEAGVTSDWVTGDGQNRLSAFARVGFSEVAEEDSLLSVEGQFSVLQIEARRFQSLAAIMPRWSAEVGVDLQYAADDLDASERLSLGGAHGVRAYRAGEAQGDRGALLRSELRRDLEAAHGWLGRTQLFGLLDAGVTEIDQADSSQTRAALGAGVRFREAGQHYIDLSYAVNIDTDGEDNAGDAARFWAQGVYWF